MSKDTETTPRKKNKGGQFIAYGMMAMIIGGLGGFGITNFGGGLSVLGSVGDQEITAQDYQRAMDGQIRALRAQFGPGFTFAQAQAFGLDRQVLQDLINQAALDSENARMGLSVGDAAVAEQVRQTSAFQGAAGAFDREAYKFALKQVGLDEGAFESSVRRDLARGLLQVAVAQGMASPQTMVDTLYAWQYEERGFSTLPVTFDDVTAALPEATDADLQAFYTDNIAQFTKPEAKRITYSALLPEDIAADQTVDEAALKAAYDANISEYVQPEKRLVERLVYPSQAEAEAAKARLDGGEDFSVLVAERGLELNDIDLGDVAKDDLGAAGDAVFALTEPGVVGPLDSDFGPALFRMNGILAAQETTFDEAKADLAVEAQTDAARRAISDKVETIDDLLAGGISLEDLAKEQGMKTATVDFVATNPSPEGISAYPAFRKAAQEVTESDFPKAVILDDGGVVALRLDEVVAPAPIPFDEARDAVLAAWTGAEKPKAVSARAAEIKAAVEGGASLGSFGIVGRTARLGRDGFVEGAPSDLVAQVFQMTAGELRVIEGPGFTAVVRLDDILPAATDGDQAIEAKDAIASAMNRDYSQDVLTMFTRSVTNDAGLTLDQNVVNGVNALFN